MDEKLPPPTPHEQAETLDRERQSRRTFLMNLGIALNAAVGILIATPAVAYVIGPILRRRDYREWVDLGPIAGFPPGETRLVTYRNPYSTQWDGLTANIPAYVRCAEPGSFTVFAINCAHLGCPVRWFAESQLFMCPCHGGVYYADGSRASGPPERGLFTYEQKIRSGHLMIKAGQIPTLRNSASLEHCPGTQPAPPQQIISQIVPRIESCPPSDRGTGSSTIG
ncbi:MAG TPA: Rieske 2Fe-2S domain-containing protein [Terracidiphilus sp.]|jgi:Rieske Fe-S protein|nr:Rieske 2Fe-2S domain-containing protein [Terracidiphilus sp.]